MKKTNQKTINRQDGVTLLLAILVLAAITAVAFSLAAIITIEIRSSGDVLRTEPALYAVQGVTEEAFFKYKRLVSDADLDIAVNDTAGDTTGCVSTAPNVCLINGVSLGQPLPAARQYDPSPRVDIIPANGQGRYLFIDPALPNDFGHAYDSVSITDLNGVLGVTAVFTVCCDANGNSTVVYSDSLTPNVPDTRTLSGNGQYEMVVQNPSPTSVLLLQVDTVKTVPINGSQKWLPLTSKTMDISASYLGLTRKYTIQIPQP